MINIIKGWRKAFNLPVRTKFELPSQDEFELAVRLIREELAELEEAYHNKDKKEYLDACADLAFVYHQVNCISGTPIEEAVNRVAKSNMSKSCRYYSDAVESVKAYAAKGIDAYIREYKGLYFIYRSTDNKLLKGIHFKEPDFTGLLNTKQEEYKAKMKKFLTEDNSEKTNKALLDSMFGVPNPNNTEIKEKATFNNDNYQLTEKLTREETKAKYCTNTKCNCETCGKSAQVDLYSERIINQKPEDFNQVNSDFKKKKL